MSKPNKSRNRSRPNSIGEVARYIGARTQSYLEIERENRAARANLNSLLSAGEENEDLYSNENFWDAQERFDDIIERTSHKMNSMEQVASMAYTSRVARQAISIAGMAEARSEVASGYVNISRGGKSSPIGVANLRQELESQSKALLEGMSAMRDSAKMTAEEFESLRKATNEAADNVVKLDRALSASGRGGGGSLVSMAPAIGAGLNFVGNAYGQIMAGHRIAAMGNQAGFASLANQQYDMYRAAMAGDMQSLMILNQWGSAGDFGSAMQMHTKIGQGIGVAGDAVSAAGDIAIMAGTGGAGMGVKAIAGSRAVGGVSKLGVGVSDMLRNISGGQANLAGTQQYMQLMQALSHVSAQQWQSYRDFGVGARGLAGMTGSASGFMAGAMNLGLMTDMEAAGLGVSEWNALMSAGIGASGSMGVRSALTAKQFANMGMGTAGTNMAAMANLNLAGANNPEVQFATIMQQAVAAGINDSKAFSQLIENTSMLSQSGTRWGIDTTSAAAGMFAMATPGAATHPNRLIAGQVGANNLNIANTFAQGNDSMFSKALRFERLARATGLGTDDLLAIEDLDQATIRELIDDPEKAKRVLAERGYRGATDDIGGLLSKVAGVNQDMSQRGGTLGAMFAHNKKLAWKLSGGIGGRDETMMAMDINNSAPRGTTEQTELLKSATTVVNAQGRQEMQALMSVATKFEKASDGLTLIAKVLEEKLKDGSQEDKLRDSAAQAAADQRIVGKFGNSVDEFGRHVEALGRIAKVKPEERAVTSPRNDSPLYGPRRFGP